MILVHAIIMFFGFSPYMFFVSIQSLQMQKLLLLVPDVKHGLIKSCYVA